MDRNFFTNDFESLLKENADQFKMYPSKKVWHGVYNDMHPGRRWPSIAMSLFLVFTLVIVGRLNIQKFEKTSLAAVHKHEANGAITATNILTNFSKRTPKANIQPDLAEKQSRFILSSSDKANTTMVNVKAVEPADKPEIMAKPTNDVLNSLLSDNQLNNNAQNSGIEQKKNLENGNLIFNDETPEVKNFDKPLTAFVNTPVDLFISSASNQNLKDKAAAPSQYIKAEPVTNNTNFISQTSKSIHRFKHRSNKIRWAYYVTPSVSYRIMSKNNYNSNQAYSYYTNVNSAVDHSAALGFEAGTAFKFSINKKFKFTSGLQFNYSAYNIQANNIHPMLATLMVSNSGSSIPSVISGISFFSNGRGFSPIKLHNYSFQASVPVGFEYIISDNDYLQFSTAANLQPSYIISNHSYLLSSDKRNYLTHPSLLRNFNMNSSAGLFVSFKSKLLDLQVGPEVRYQLFSTYKKAYPVSEHLINYGISFSVSRTLK